MPVNRLGAAQALKLQRVGYKLIDVRAPEEYGKGHPTGAWNVPYQLFDSSGGYKANPDFMTVMQGLFAKGVKLLLLDKVGTRSLAAGDELCAAGYADVADVRPGYMGIVGNDGRYLEDGWETLGLPSETQTDRGSYAELKAKTMASEAVAAEEGPQAAVDSGRVGAAQGLKMQRVGYKLIDVRAPEEYAKAHPAGALNVPYQLFGAGGGYRPNPDFIAVMQGLFANDAKLLLLDKIGKSSVVAMEELKAAGFTTVSDVRPGYMGIVGNDGRYLEDGWETLGLPSEKQTDGGSYAELKDKALGAAVVGEAVAQKAQTADGRVGAAQALKMQRVGYKLIDLRTPEEYAKGHPSGALNVPHQFFGAGGSFKPNADFMTVMQAVFAKDTKLLLIDKTGKRSPAAVDELKAAGYTTVCDVRPGYMGIVAPDGSYLEDGWQTLGLASEKQTDGCSYAELKAKAGI